MSLKNTFRNNVVAPYSKHNTAQEKLAEVLAADEKRNVCSISYKNIDGMLVVKDDVPVKNNSLKGVVSGFPKAGDYVEIEEVGKVIRITGLIEKSRLTTENSSNNDSQAGPSSYGGFLGY